MIEKLKYISLKGSVAYVGLGVNRSQFDGMENGLKVHNEGIVGVSWICDNELEVVFTVKGGCLFAYPTPDMSKIIIIYADDEIKKPDNAVVFNEDGTRFCQLIMPDRLSKPEGRNLPQGELQGFMQCGWFDDRNYMTFECYIGESDFIETRLLRLADFQFDKEYYHTWKM